MGNRLRAGKSPRFVTGHSGQLNLLRPKCQSRICLLCQIFLQLLLQLLLDRWSCWVRRRGAAQTGCRGEWRRRWKVSDECRSSRCVAMRPSARRRHSSRHLANATTENRSASYENTVGLENINELCICSLSYVLLGLKSLCFLDVICNCQFYLYFEFESKWSWFSRS